MPWPPRRCRLSGECSHPDACLLTLCTIIEVPRPPRRCRLSGECSHPDACILTLCTNPCLTNNPCDITAECKPYNRTAYCACPRGWFGDPFEECILHPLLRRIFRSFLIDDLVLHTVGENVIVTPKMRNNYGAIQSFIFPILW